MARLVLWPVALVGGVVLAVAGCTGDPAPIVTETPSASVSASASPSVSASPSPTALTPEEVLDAIPEGARGEDFASASEFAKFFVKQYGVMFQTQDDELFRALSTAQCKFCESSLGSLAEEVAAGQRTVGGEVTTEEGLAAGGLQDDGTWNASFDIDVAPSATVDKSGAVVAEYPAEALRVGVLLAYEEGHWVVLGVNSEPR